MDTREKQRIPTNDNFGWWAIHNKPKSERFTLALRKWELARLGIEAEAVGMNKGNYILALLCEQWRQQDAADEAAERQLVALVCPEGAKGGGLPQTAS